MPLQKIKTYVVDSTAVYPGKVVKTPSAIVVTAGENEKGMGISAGYLEASKEGGVIVAGEAFVFYDKDGAAVDVGDYLVSAADGKVTHIDDVAGESPIYIIGKALEAFTPADVDEPISIEVDIRKWDKAESNNYPGAPGSGDSGNIELLSKTTGIDFSTVATPQIFAPGVGNKYVIHEVYLVITDDTGLTGSMKAGLKYNAAQILNSRELIGFNAINEAYGMYGLTGGRPVIVGGNAFNLDITQAFGGTVVGDSYVFGFKTN